MLLLPPPEGTCPVCAVEHDDEEPHDATSLYYQSRFMALRNRGGTWADAVAHCSDETQRAWKRALLRAHAWTEPPAGEEPIADPPAESLHQAIGDIAGPTISDESE